MQPPVVRPQSPSDVQKPLARPSYTQPASGQSLNAQLIARPRGNAPPPFLQPSADLPRSGKLAGAKPSKHFAMGDGNYQRASSVMQAPENLLEGDEMQAEEPPVTDTEPEDVVAS